ncbi:twin-arginine translocation signal domain-containing protein, partial [Acinetobacter baumannii]
MLGSSRRGFLAGSAALPATTALARVPEDLAARVAGDLDRYIG